MATPTLTPVSQTSTVVLPATGTHADVATSLAFGIYGGSTDFISGAVDQVSYVHSKIGGEILDIELTTGQVYSAYEEAVLEYSYIVNVHQAKNVLSNVLGNSTASFNQDGEMKAGEKLSGSNPGLKYPRFEFAYARRVAEGISAEVGIGGAESEYSASFTAENGVQDYDLQTLISSSAATDSSLPFYGKVGNTKILVKKVFYKTPRSTWRFYGYYGGLNVIGNFSTYGQYADDSTFQIIPVWHNRLQAAAFEEAIYVRNSHYSYEIKNNKLRIFPIPATGGPKKYWVQFTIPGDAWEEETGKENGATGINNMNTLPFDNIPYTNINSIGKQWIRRFALSLCKEMLGQVRGKFATIPIPGESVQLNASELLSQAKEEQEKLREELKTTLDELTYVKLMEGDSALVEGSSKIHQTIPNPIYMG